MLNKLLKVIVDVGVICLLVFGLTACGGGGGSSTVAEQSYTPPPPPTTTTYTPPGWDGINFYASDPNGEQWIEAEYRRLTQD